MFRLAPILLALALTTSCKKEEPPTQEPPAEAATKPGEKGAIPAGDGQGTVVAKDGPQAAADNVDPDRNLQRELALSQVVSLLLEERHLLRRAPDDAMSRKAFDELLDRMDPGRLFLLQADVDQLQKSAESLDDQLASGRLDLALEAGKRLKARLEVVSAVVDKHLKAPLDLTDTEEIETDSDKRPWAKTEEALADRWRRVLENGLLNRIHQMVEADKAAVEAKTPVKKDDRPVAVRAQAKLRETYDARFDRLKQQKAMDWLESFINAITSVYDPHTLWLPPKEKQDFDIRMTGRLEGIGAVLSVDGYFIKVVRIVPGSASWRAGELKAEDQILAVAQGDKDAVDVVGMRLSDAVQLIRGKKGTEVRLTVRKADGAVKVMPIIRDVVRIETTYARGAVLTHPKGGMRVGYIDVPSFYGDRRGGGVERTSSGDVLRLLKAFEKQEVDAVILDLRSNGGGFLEDARRMAGHFFSKGPVVQTRAFSGHSEVLKDDDPEIAWKGPLVVMVNRFSASASEIVAGALQDYGRAVLVGAGDSTHGKGTVQTLVNMDRLVPDSLQIEGVVPLGVMKITQQQYYRVSGGSTQLKGITPDLILPDPVAYLETGERSYDTALPWDELKGLPFPAWKKPAWKLETLRARSDERVGKDPAFARVRQRVDLLEKRKGATIWPLQQEAWEARRAGQAEALEALDDPKDAPSRFEASVVRYAKRNTPLADGEKDPLLEWVEFLRKDAWLAETLLILGDMKAAK